MKPLEIKRKAMNLGISNALSMDMDTLIRAIQVKEGFSPCFKTGSTDCVQFACLWQSMCRPAGKAPAPMALTKKRKAKAAQ